MPIDIIVIILLLIACYKGFQKGLIIAVFSIVAFVVGMAAALKLSTMVAAYLKESANISAKWLPFLSFLIVFIGVVILVRLVAKILEKTTQMIMLGWANRLGGIFFYIALYLIIFSVFLFYAEKFNLFQKETVQTSQAYPYIHGIGPYVMDCFGNIIPLFKDMFKELNLFFEGISNKTK